MLQDEFMMHELNITPYFEGWYYRFYQEGFSFAFIMSLHKTKEGVQGCIQYIDTNHNEVQQMYEADEVFVSMHPFQCTMKDSTITSDHILIVLHHIRISLSVQSSIKLPKSWYMPTIMGPFSYMNMECTHAIISLHHQMHGSMKLHDQSFPLEGIGYTEKDRGCSFPSSYIWFQSNHTTMKDSCLFLSVANIPFLNFHFQGFICVLMIQKKQYRFATYLGARVKCKKTMQGIRLECHQYPYTLHIDMVQKNAFPLKAPQHAELKKTIHESLDSIASMRLYRKHMVIQHHVFEDGGMEIVGDW